MHDLLEDTKATYQEIADISGNYVADGVLVLTDVTVGSFKNRAARKKADLERLVRSSPEIKTIKLADLLDNTGSIKKHDA